MYDIKVPDPILLVDDNENDILLAERIFKQFNLKDQLIVIQNGKDALDLIKKTKYEKAGRFAVIFLDLKLPVISGIKVLEELKKENFFESPIVILSTSGEKKDIDECYRLNANSYIKKPVDYNEFLSVMKATVNYWLRINMKINNKIINYNGKGSH